MNYKLKTQVRLYFHQLLTIIPKNSLIKLTLAKDLSFFEKWLKVWPTFKSLAQYSLATVA